MYPLEKILLLSLVPLVFARGFGSYSGSHHQQTRKLCLVNVTSEEYPGNFTMKEIVCSTACCKDGCCHLEPWAVALYALAGICIMYAVVQSVVTCRRKKIVDCNSRMEEAK